MKKNSSPVIAGAIVSILAVFAPSAWATVIPTTTENDQITSSSGFNSNPEFSAISGTDLIEVGSSALSSVVGNAGDTTYGSLAGLNDGQHIPNGAGTFANSTYYGYNSSANGGAAKNNLIVDNSLAGAGAIVTFNLNTAANPLGYNINTITTVAGWQDHLSVSDQNYTISYTLVGSATTYTLGSVAYNPYDPATQDPVTGGNPGAGSLVGWTGLGLVGVSSLTFDFTADPSSLGYGNSGTGLWLQEIDATGTATVPEPSTWAMMMVAGAGIVLLSLRRLVRA